MPVQNVDTEPEAIAVELGGRPYIANAQDRPRGVEPDGLRSVGWSWPGIRDGFEYGHGVPPRVELE